jgi:maltose alpha-D-glucosyltransferase/alpha-amylase
MQYAATLGRRTAELHRAFATPTDNPDFAAEPFGPDDLAAATDDARRLAERAFAALDRLAKGDEPASSVVTLLARRRAVDALLDDFARGPAAGLRTRIHGDFHLGQILIVQDDVIIVDFEGEPSRPAEQRRLKSSPLRDVAGMLRSFAYAAETAARDFGSRFNEAKPRAEEAVRDWRRLAETAFLDAYAMAARDSAIWIEDEAVRTRLLRLFLLAKALYEIGYEADNRPDWIETPVRGVLALLGEPVGGPA